MANKQITFTIIIFINLCLPVLAQPKVNYNERAIEPYVLPELLITKSGEKIDDVDSWENKRKPEILEAYKNQVYGNIPKGFLNPSSVQVIEQSNSALDNTAIRKQIVINFKKEDKKLTINVLLYLPKEIADPPVFVGYNFYGNQTTTEDPNVILTQSWIPNDQNMGISDQQATEASRGKRSDRWPIKKIISEGFGLATIYYGDVDPDRDDFTDGIHPFFYTDGQDKPNDDEWGSISAWAWGLSRVLDYLKTDGFIRNSKYLLFGHSRLGKTSLWAGALDERFDMVISNDSGCGGAALFRRKYGETAAIINENFPHWFSTNFKKYSNNETSLPVDQHMLIALIAPRPVYIASAEEDQWADPKGEFLSGYYASPVYELYGANGLTNTTFPEVNQPIQNTIGYHIRPGKHDVMEYDWEQFMLFAKKHFWK